MHPKKYAYGFCFAVICCGYTLTDFPISTRLTSLALWQINYCPSASKQPRWIWINTSCEFFMNDCITTTKQSTTKLCAYFLGYTVVTYPCWDKSYLMLVKGAPAYTGTCPGVGATKPISSVPLFSKFFRTAKTHVSYWISRLYLAGIAAAQLRWHLSNMNVVEIV